MLCAAAPWLRLQSSPFSATHPSAPRFISSPARSQQEPTTSMPRPSTHGSRTDPGVESVSRHSSSVHVSSLSVPLTNAVSIPSCVGPSRSRYPPQSPAGQAGCGGPGARCPRNRRVLPVGGPSGRVLALSPFSSFQLSSSLFVVSVHPSLCVLNSCTSLSPMTSDLTSLSRLGTSDQISWTSLHLLLAHKGSRIRIASRAYQPFLTDPHHQSSA